MAFMQCPSLTALSLPESLMRIETGAFMGCTSLENINIPSAVSYIGEGAFSNTKWLDNQPDGIVYAGNVAYTYKGEMPAAASLKLHSKTIGIAECAFQGCENLAEISISESVRDIGRLAFGGCTSLKSITLPAQLLTIKSETFKGCTQLAYVSVGDTMLIEWNAFDGCSSLKSLTLPYITNIEENAFGYSYNPSKGSYSKYSGLSITGYSDSPAQEYAARNGFDFISRGTSETGDINGDHKRTLIDCVMLNQFLICGRSLSPQELCRADITGNGLVNVLDFIALKSLFFE